ncbi:MAG: helicase-related protein [Acetobacteraceae bacterium]|nr:helicase-related protein [Acetobacteraceae bacterium]
MSPRDDSARVRAVLGPTNTGKTHLAVERMLAHESGVIGFPLRLLARETYDRIASRLGPARVALVTGEEKIVPPSARWFCCTVEAMPLERRFAFLAVDEIQLCADPDRGHVFTDRLLNARGAAETMFLGAETIRPLLRRLVPEAEIETRPRLSALTHIGPVKLSRLPPRTAIVAFSAAEVYAIAEAIRRRRGGCAVVMGRLSPRTRNAQVALYQAKEVDFLVATDAIGMGLNMDVNHVAFAGLAKFDGRRLRDLTPAEVAQIAGRAGRGMSDGSFGTTANAPPLPPETVEAVETHRFDPLQALVWRNAALDFSSLAALLASLDRPPPAPGLLRGPDAADHLALASLARDPEIAGLARDPPSVRLLWEACQIPDYRKLGDESHARLCGRIFRALRTPPYRVDPAWVGREIESLDRSDGDIETLMGRLANARTWAYVAGRADWLRRPGTARRTLPRAGGSAVRRAARAAHRPLRRSPGRAPDPTPRRGRRGGPALRRHTGREGGGRRPCGGADGGVRLPPGDGSGRGRAAGRVAGGAAGACAGGPAACRRFGGRRRRRFRSDRSRAHHLARGGGGAAEARAIGVEAPHRGAGCRVPGRRRARTGADAARALAGPAGRRRLRPARRGRGGGGTPPVPARPCPRSRRGARHRLGGAPCGRGEGRAAGARGAGRASGDLAAVLAPPRGDPAAGNPLGRRERNRAAAPSARGQCGASARPRLARGLGARLGLPAGGSGRGPTRRGGKGWGDARRPHARWPGPGSSRPRQPPRLPGG